VIDSFKQNKTYIVGIAGGSGSGKTYFAKDLARRLNHICEKQVCEIVYQDNFYFDQSERFDYDGGSVNFDHPNSIDFASLARSIKKLKNGESAEIPVYDFATHKRKPETLLVPPRPVILVDGILIFHSSEVRSLFDDLIFFETSENLRFQRRLDRDVKERGRTPEGVKQQFLKQVKPMHDQFVEPSKAFANIIFNDLHLYQGMVEHYSEKLCENLLAH